MKAVLINPECSIICHCCNGSIFLPVPVPVMFEFFSSFQLLVPVSVQIPVIVLLLTCLRLTNTPKKNRFFMRWVLTFQGFFRF